MSPLYVSGSLSENTTIDLGENQPMGNAIPVAYSGRSMSGRFCTTCGHQSLDEAGRCANCSVSLGPSCPVCNQAVPAGSKFCGQCGATLTAGQSPAPSLPTPDQLQQTLRTMMPTALAEKIDAASVKILGEQREVTVLFLGLTNFAAATHDLDSEDIYLVMDEAMSLLAEVVYKFEGTIDKFTGTGLMALFGAPVTHENDAERAVRAALEMQARLQPLRQNIKQTYGFDFETRIGINTGRVIAGKVGSNLHMEYTVIGDTVNLASQLEAAAKPSMILVSEETYQRTRPLFQFEPPSASVRSGLPQTFRAFQAIQLLDKPGRVRGLPGLQVPMVGRTGDLTRLQQALETVRQDGQSRLALITGEAGLGKSRLVAEFRTALDPSEVSVYEGSCLAYARSAPLWVIAEMLRNMLGISETLSSEDQWGQLQAYLTRLELANDDVTPYLAQVLGLKQVEARLEDRIRLLDAAMLQRQTHTALRRLFMAQARLAPTVLIFEDLHWVDPASRGFLEYFIQTSSDVPLLLVLIAREAERETVIRPLVVVAENEPDRLVDLPLKALSETDGNLMVNQLITETTGEAHPLKQQIVRRAVGNPFYVEEIIRMLIDQGGLTRERDDEPWLITAEAKQLLSAVPGTVKGLILTRFDRLPEAIRRTLQRAAVLGDSFSVTLLQMVSDIGFETMMVHLHELAARQFISPGAGQAESSYVFYHVLLQETVYSTLLKRDRQQIHMQVALAIERSNFFPPEEQSEALAYHFAESGNLTRAIPYLIAAAENAERRCAYETAIKHYRRAQPLLSDEPNGQSDQFFRVRLGLGRSLKFVGEFAAADEILSDTLHHVWGWGSAAEAEVLWPIMVECLRQMADLRQREGIYDEALTYLDAGLQVIGQAAAQEKPGLWRLLVDRMAWIRFRQGQLEEAFSLASNATTGSDAEDNEDPITFAKLYNTLAGVAWHQGQFDEAIVAIKHSLKLYESIGYLWGTAIAYGNLGILHDVQGNWSEAAEYYQQAYESHRVTGDLQNQAGNLDNLGTLHMTMGAHQKARQELEESLSIRQRLGDGWGIAQSQVNLAHLAIIQARFQEGATFAEAALARADQIESSEIQVQARWILALIQAELDQLETALHSAQVALEMAQAAGLLEKEAECLRVLGMLRGRAGQHSEAESLLKGSIDLARKQSDPYRHGLALLELGRVYRAWARADHAGQPVWQAKALVSLKEAAKIFESLGATYDFRLAQADLEQLGIDP